MKPRELNEIVEQAVERFRARLMAQLVERASAFVEASLGEMEPGQPPGRQRPARANLRTQARRQKPARAETNGKSVICEGCGQAFGSLNRHSSVCPGRANGRALRAGKRRKKKRAGRDMFGAGERATRQKFAQPRRRCLQCGTLLHAVEAELRRHAMGHGAGGQEPLDRMFAPPVHPTTGTTLTT